MNGAITLQVRPTVPRYNDGGKYAPLVVRATDRDCNTVFYAQRYHCELGPYWRGNERRLDEQGRMWERPFTAVTDDFGTLVEVPA
jgi:hypothetical protein